jgi:hypothetical protein
LEADFLALLRRLRPNADDVANVPQMAAKIREPTQQDFPSGLKVAFFMLFWVNNEQEVPFYVGETGRLNERMDDYCVKQFGAATDFRVGEAICYIRDEWKFTIVVRYKPSSDRKKEEYLIVRNLQTSGVRLLNDLLSYNYKHADKQDEREAVRKFCDVLRRSAPLPPRQNRTFQDSAKAPARLATVSGVLRHRRLSTKR